MALLQRTRVLSAQRVDLPDYRGIEDMVCADFKAIHKYVWSNNNFVFSGFNSTGTGTTELSIELAGSSAVIGADDGTMYIGAPSLSALTTSALTPASTNYIELEIVQDTGGADSRAFWDQTANGGQGGEFSQIIDTYIFLKAEISISTSNFSGEADKLPICEVDVNGAGTITAIRDARNMFFRLGRANDPEYVYPWASRTEPVDTQFGGADKDIKRVKEMFDAIMTEIKEIKEVPYWFNSAQVSLTAGFRNAALSFITAIGNKVAWTWDGSQLELSDDNINPTPTDVVAAIRLFDSISNLELTRQEVGREVQEIIFSDSPDAGTFTLEHDGDISNIINFNDDAADVLAACNATFTSQLLAVTGNFEQGFKFTFLNGGPQNEMTVDSNSLEKGLNSVTVSPATIKNGFTGSQAIPLADGEVLWIELPKPLTDETYSDLGIISSNFRVSARGSVPLSDTTYWLAFREGSNVYLRNHGELQPGESLQISDNVNENILQAIGLASETSMPSYSSTNVISQGASIVTAISELDTDLGQLNRILNQLKLNLHETDSDKARISAADVLLLDGNTYGQAIGEFLLAFDGAVIDFTLGEIFEADGVTPLGINFTPFAIPSGEYFWYGVSLTPGNLTADNRQLVTVQIDLATASNANPILAPKALMAGEIKLGAVQVLNNAGNIEVSNLVKLGTGSGSGSGGAFKVDFHDPLTSSLPGGTSFVVDNVAAQDGDLILFTNLAVDNNQVYEISGVGTGIVFTAKRPFKGQLTPLDGDTVRILKGDSFQDQLGVFNGTDWEFNKTVRYFDGANYWEQSSLKTVNLLNNTTDNVFSVNVSGSENWILGYSILRGANKETGHLYITSDGINASVANSNAYVGSSMGVTFDASIAAGLSNIITPAANLSQTTGFIGASYQQAQPFEIPVNGNLNYFSIYMARGTGADAEFTAYIYDDAAGEPGSLLYTSTNIIDAQTDLGLTESLVQFNFASASLTANTLYHFVIIPTSVVNLSTAPNNVATYANTAVAPYDDALSSSNSGSTWSPIVSYLAFELEYEDISAGSELELIYETDNSGPDATMKFFYQRWSDSAGGPGGVPNYSGGGSGIGTVSSVGLSISGSVFDVSGSPITTAGTFIVTPVTQAANTVWAGPTAGGPLAPTFRSLVSADIPNLDASKITSGTLAVAQGGTGLANPGALGNVLTSDGVGNWVSAPNVATGSGINGELQFVDNAGTLVSDPEVRYDITEEVIDLNGLKIGKLSAPITLLDNQNIPQDIAIIGVSSIRHLVIEYSIVRDTTMFTGTAWIVNDGTTPQIANQGVGIGSTGILIDVKIDTGNIVLTYTSTPTGDDGEFKYSIRSWT